MSFSSAEGLPHNAEIGVVGTGQMGLGIAQVFAQAGRSVWLVDRCPEALLSAKAVIQESLGRFVRKGKLTEHDQAETMTRLQFIPELESAPLSRTGLVVEAVVEDEAVKGQVFRQLDSLLPPETLLASNTSSIPISRLAKHTRRPEQVVGMHFMNPVPLMPLVEIIAAAQTSECTLASIEQLVKDLGKTSVRSADFPGFIANRVLMPLINEAAYALHEGVGTPEAIDTVMKLGMNHPMGPLALADLIGLDTVLSILMVLSKAYGDARFRPCPLISYYVDAGYTGRKAGRGFYQYSNPP